jgi:hypothetical protein
MRVKNVFITLIVVGLAGYGALKLYVFYKAKENFQQILYCAGMPRMPADVPKSNIFDYDHISASVFGPIGIKGLKIRIPPLDEEINFGEVILTYDYDGDLKKCPTPKHVNFTINDLRMNVSLIDKIAKNNEAMRARGRNMGDPVPELVRRLGYADLYMQSTELRALGYDQLVMDISFDLAFNPDDQEATFTVYEKVKGLGDFNFKITVTGMAKNINSAVLGVKLKEAKLEYHDESYVGRLFKMFADAKKVDVANYRKEIINNLDADFAGKQIKLSPDSIKNFKSFLDNPKHLIVTLYPYEPVGIESIKLYKPGDVPMLLNLQIFTQ